MIDWVPAPFSPALDSTLLCLLPLPSLLTPGPGAAAPSSSAALLLSLSLPPRAGAEEERASLIPSLPGLPCLAIDRLVLVAGGPATAACRIKGSALVSCLDRS